MPGAIIAYDQVQAGGPTFGSPGVARNDLQLLRLVTCRSTASGNTSYAWTFLDIPPGSAAALANASTPNATFTPDLAGSYRIQLITNGGGPGNIQILIAAVRYDNAGLLTHRGWRIPALGEVATEDGFFGQTRGWSEALEFILSDILAALTSGAAGGIQVDDEGTPIAGNPHTEVNFVGDGVTVTNVAGVATVTIPGVPPAFDITSFVDSFGSLIELGATATNPGFTASYLSPPDVTANSVTIVDDQGHAVVDETGTPTGFTYAHAYTKTVYGNAVNFTLTAKKGAQTRTAGSALTWVQKLYHGVGAAGQTTAAFILSLTGALGTSRVTTFTDTAGSTQKIYFACRAAYGTPSFTVGGFSGGFTLVSSTIAVTNTQGITENYQLWESDNLGLGTTVVGVS